MDADGAAKGSSCEFSRSAAKTSKPIISKEESERIHRLLQRVSDHFSNTVFQPPPAGHMDCTDALASLWSEKVSIPALTGSVVSRFDIMQDYNIEDEEGDNDELVMGVDKPIETLKILIRMDWEGMGVCDSCAKTKRRDWREEIKDVWNRIDDWMELV